MIDSDITTVAQLIEALKAFDPDLPVLVTGYETGYENCHYPQLVELTHQPMNTYYDGEYQHPENCDPGEQVKAVILERVVRSD